MCIQKAYVIVKKRISLYHDQYQTKDCTLLLNSISTYSVLAKANQEAQLMNDTSQYDHLTYLVLSSSS